MLTSVFSCVYTSAIALPISIPPLGNARRDYLYQLEHLTFSYAYILILIWLTSNLQLQVYQKRCR
jgi:hypothetical protein